MLCSFIDVMRATSDTEYSKILVFCNQKRTCEFLQRKLRSENIHSQTLHGDHSQGQREAAIYGVFQCLLLYNKVLYLNKKL